MPNPPRLRAAALAATALLLAASLAGCGDDTKKHLLLPGGGELALAAFAGLTTISTLVRKYRK